VSATTAYEDFCYVKGLLSWPASPQSLLEYACARAAGYPISNLSRLAPQSVEHHISALRSFYVDRRWPCDAFTDDRLRWAVSGISNCFKKPQRLRLPLGHTLLTKILSIRVADPSAKHRINTINFFTALKVAYASFMRLRKITYLNNITTL